MSRAQHRIDKFMNGPGGRADEGRLSGAPKTKAAAAKA